MQRRTLGPNHQVASTLLRLSALELARSRPAEAEVHAREAVEIRAARLPEGHWLRAMSEVGRAEALLALGRHRETVPWLERAAAVLARQFGERDMRTMNARLMVTRAATVAESRY
jgi:hypothetical protein